MKNRYVCECPFFIDDLSVAYLFQIFISFIINNIIGYGNILRDEFTKLHIDILCGNVRIFFDNRKQLFVSVAIIKWLSNSLAWLQELISCKKKV